MLVGVPREVKNHEYRVAITPAGVVELPYVVSLADRGMAALSDPTLAAGLNVADGSVKLAEVAEAHGMPFG